MTFYFIFIYYFITRFLFYFIFSAHIILYYYYLLYILIRVLRREGEVLLGMKKRGFGQERNVGNMFKFLNAWGGYFNIRSNIKPLQSFSGDRGRTIILLGENLFCLLRKII